MNNELSTLQPNSLTRTRKDGDIEYIIKTVGQDYTVDSETGEKLSKLLLENSTVKFVKIKTDGGHIVLNLAAIMGLIVSRVVINGVVKLTKEEIEKYV